MSTVYLHLGMPKTGTTFLQTSCFPFLCGLRYNDSSLISLLDKIAYTNPAFLELESLKLEVARIVNGLCDKLLISHERLFGNMLKNFWDHSYITGCLQQLFPDARIILVVRKQDELVESIYKQSLQSGYYQGLNSFLNYRKNEFRESGDYLGQPNLDINQLDLHRYVQSYVSTFGRSNLLVLPYELLRSDRTAFLDKLFAFLEIDPFYPPPNGRENRSYSWLSSYLALGLNRFAWAEGDGSRLLQFIPNKPLSPFLSGPPTDQHFVRTLRAINRGLTLRHLLQNGLDRIVYTRRSLISEKKRKLILDLHRDSNSRLDQEFDLDLRRFCYY